MMLAWHWPWAALAGVLATLAIIVLIVVFARRNAADDTPVFSMDDDLNTEHASRLFRQWRALGRLRHQRAGACAGAGHCAGGSPQPSGCR